MKTHASEILVLNKPMKQKLLIIERKILRRKFRPAKDRDGTWRIKTNYELRNLIRNMNIINYIKAETLSWLNHVYQMTNDRMVKKLQVYKW